MESEHALFTHFALNQVFSFQTSTSAEKPVDVQSRNSESPKLPSREFEEEIANLLIEFKNQDPSSSPKRKSPSSSPLRFETPSSPTMLTPSTTPTQKRRKTSSKSYQNPTSEVSGSDADEPYSDDSTPSLRQFKKSHGEDSEFEYEEDGYGSAEEYFEEDDDEWLDAGKSTTSVQDATSPTTGRLVRKKAPSGSACEKHKRWKKRCPDDCPMRSSKQQRKRKVTETQFSNNTVSQNSRLSEIEQQDIIQNLYVFVQQASATSPPSIADCLSLIRWSLQQLAAKNVVSTSEFSSLEAALLLKLSASESESAGVRSRRTRGLKPEDQIYSEYEISPSTQRRVALSSMACEKHTALHARCPPNCPERRPAEAIARRKKATKGDDSSDKEYSAKSPKPKSTKSKGRTGRKYLPQACDRHKLLHAKCPANCPDRIKRDAEAAAKVRSPMEISVTA